MSSTTLTARGAARETSTTRRRTRRATPGRVVAWAYIVVILFVFGGSRLPQVGDGLGRAIRNFKTALRGDNEIDVTPRADAGRRPGRR